MGLLLLEILGQIMWALEIMRVLEVGTRQDSGGDTEDTGAGGTGGILRALDHNGSTGGNGG